jgi:hypothetical protein
MQVTPSTKSSTYKGNKKKAPTTAPTYHVEHVTPKTNTTTSDLDHAREDHFCCDKKQIF